MTDRSSGARTRAAVIGAGRMGHGIALEAARGGFSVAIYDTQPGRAEAAIAEAASDANHLVAAGCIEASDIPAIVDRLTAATDLESAAVDAEVVFEAVAEDLDVKRRVFARLDGAAPSPRPCCCPTLPAWRSARSRRLVSGLNGWRWRTGSCRRTSFPWLKSRLGHGRAPTRSEPCEFCLSGWTSGRWCWNGSCPAI